MAVLPGQRLCRLPGGGKYGLACTPYRAGSSLGEDKPAAGLPGGGEIVAYCRGANCVLAHDAVRLLAARGWPARRLADGMLEWRLAGLPVTAGQPA